MHPFTYHQADSAADAVRALALPAAAALGGGTDLLVAMKEDIVRPGTLVDLRRIPGARDITLHDCAIESMRHSLLEADPSGVPSS